MGDALVARLQSHAGLRFSIEEAPVPSSSGSTCSP
jgi:hypothetical protein